MERTTDWKVPAALILAGLALFVALSGRNFFSFPGGPQNAQATPFRVELDAPPPPNAPGTLKPLPDIQKVPSAPNPPFDNLGNKFQFDPQQLRNALDANRDPMQGLWDYIQGLIEYLSPALQLAALGLLIWLAYGYLTRRNRPTAGYIAAPPAQPQAPAQTPPPPSSHGDITRPESGPE